MGSQMMTVAPRFSVSDFVAVVNQVLETAVPVVEVEGEIAEFTMRQQKFVFFTLRDHESAVNCFMMAWQLRTPIEEGMRVVVRASAKLTAKGKFSLTVQEIKPLGAGHLKRSAELLKAKLAAEGLFDTERKRPLPPYPARVAVISSTQAAGYADFMKIAGERWGGVQFIVANVKVQGDGAADQAVRAIAHCNQLAEPPEVIVLIRGGGSAEDLASFNDECLVRAVAGSRVPVLTGIGHEIDESLCDLAADVRAATPSNAAQLLFPDKHEVRRQLALRLGGVTEVIRQQIQERRLHVTMLQQAALEQWSHRVEIAINRALSQQRMVAEYDPEMALRRGYAMISGDCQIGSIVKITTKDKIMKARIESSEKR